jgi:hypothetical protein
MFDRTLLFSEQNTVLFVFNVQTVVLVIFVEIIGLFDATFQIRDCVNLKGLSLEI